MEDKAQTNAELIEARIKAEEDRRKEQRRVLEREVPAHCKAVIDHLEKAILEIKPIAGVANGGPLLKDTRHISMITLGVAGFVLALMLITAIAQVATYWATYTLQKDTGLAIARIEERQLQLISSDREIVSMTRGVVEGRLSIIQDHQELIGRLKTLEERLDAFLAPRKKEGAIK